MTRGLLVLAPATVARLAWSALLSTVIVLALESGPASFVLQLLFLQGAATALLSASAYARAVQLVGQQREVRAYYSGFATFVLLTGLMILIAGAMLPGDAVPREQRWACVALLTLGACATALNAFWQGVAASVAGVARAFVPGLVVSLGSCLLAPTLLLWRSPVWASALWALSQLLVPVVQWVMCRELRQMLGAPRLGSWRSAIDFLGTGSSNSGQVASVYAYREAWAGQHTSVVSANCFYASRIAELCFQVTYMAAASTPERFKTRLNRVLNTRRGRGGYALLTLAAGALAWFGTGLLGAPTVATFAVAEALSAPLRVLAMGLSILLLGRTSTKIYVVGMVLSSVAVLGAMQIPMIVNMDYGLVRGQTISGLAMVFSGLVLWRWSFEAETGDDSIGPVHQQSVAG